MITHQGQLLKKVIKKTGYPIIKLAQKLNISRTTLYKKFSLPELPTHLLITAGRILNYDFSHINAEVGEYMQTFTNSFEQMQKSYIDALQNHIDLFCYSLKLIEEGKNISIAKEIIDFMLLPELLPSHFKQENISCLSDDSHDVKDY